jgi:hypothetical protein
MAEDGWLGHGVRIGVFEFRRTARALRADSARLLLIALGVVIPGGILALVLFLFADLLRSASGPIALPPVARGSVAGLWLFGVYLVAQRTLTQRTRIEAGDLALTTVSARTVATGLVIAETCRAIAYLVLPIAVVTGALAIPVGSVASLLFVPLAVVSFAVTAVLVGATIGFAGALLVARSSFVARHTTALRTGAVVVFFGGYFLFVGSIGGVGPASLAWLPVGWYADLATLGSPIAASPLRALGSLLTATLLVGGFGYGAERLATDLWFDEPVSVDDDGGDGSEGDAASEAGRSDEARRDDATRAGIGGIEGTSADDGNGLAATGAFDRPLRVAGRPARGVARMALLRTRREPRRLSFLLTPIAIVGVSIGNVVATSGGGSVAALALVACALFGPWLAGATFALNPLGEEGAVLPTTLLAVDARTYVRGVMLPGIVFGFPFVVLLTVAGVAAAGAMASPYTAVESLGLVGIALGSTIVAVSLAPAIGTRLPRFSAISIGESRAVLPPSLLAVVAYSIPVIGLAGGALFAWLAPTGLRLVARFLVSALPTFVLDWLADEGVPVGGLAEPFVGLGEGIVALSPAAIRFGVPVLTLCVGLAVAAWSYRSTVRRIKAYEIAS